LFSVSRGVIAVQTGVVSMCVLGVGFRFCILMCILFFFFFTVDGGWLLVMRIGVSNPMSSPHCEVHPHESEGETQKGGGKSNISDMGRDRKTYLSTTGG
jgi:hypothetical protein